MNDVLTTLLVRLGESLGLGPLTLDPQGALGLAIDTQVLGLQADRERERLLLYADLGPLPAGTPAAPRETLTIRLLQANLFGRLAAGGALALATDAQDPEQPPRLVLWRSLDYAALDQSRLEQALRLMADTAADWRAALPEWDSADLHPADDEEEGEDDAGQDRAPAFNPFTAIRV
jgi:hypothetical protein